MSDNVTHLAVSFWDLLEAATDRYFAAHPELDWDVDAGLNDIYRRIEDREHRKSTLRVVREEA